MQITYSALGPPDQQRCWEAGKCLSEGLKIGQEAYKEKLRKLGLFGLVKGKLGDDVILAYH